MNGKRLPHPADRSSADLLVEIGTEELPPKALPALMRAFADGMSEGLKRSRLAHGSVRSFASPRRLAVLVETLAAGQEDRELNRKGPPVSVAFDAQGIVTKAGLAFAKKCGVDIDALGREKTAAGEWLQHAALEPGRVSADLIPGIVQHALDELPVPRRMRWGDNDEEFVRPVHWLLLLHGEDVVPASVLGITSGRVTRGHRFMSSGDIEIASPGDYVTTLEECGFVIADFALRREKIVVAVAAAATTAGGSAVGGEALYDEVAALTEWPVALTGAFDRGYLSLPKEVIVATLTGHQRYFPVEDDSGSLLPVFITLANLESKEPDKVREGNERVIHPRLADAAFFWEADRRTTLNDRAAALRDVVYQKGLGSLHDKSMRVAALASLLAKQTGADTALVTRAAVLAKCDLLTGMVGEFPELQGTMGRYYAESDGEPEPVSQAIGEQYLPRFAGDELPATVPGQLLAVADKLDTLAGVFLLGKKPTGNRDPFGLRRAALGIIRILLERNLDINIDEAIGAATAQQPVSVEGGGENRDVLYDFIVDRLRAYLVEAASGFTADMFDAVRSRRPASLLDFHARLKAVAEFITLDSAVSLAAANKRTANILRKASVTDGAEIEPLDLKLFENDAESVLYHAMQAATKEITPLIELRDYAAALHRLAELRAPVDTFFDDVMVMSDDAALRKNRLALLAELRALFLDIADISRLTPEPE